MILEHPVVERGIGYTIESWPDGLNLDCIGPWTSEASEVLRSGRVQGLTLGYTSGFAETSLGFIEDWPIDWVILIDRTLKDVSPLERLGGSVRSMTVHADIKAGLDLNRFPRLEYLDAFWAHVGDSIDAATSIKELSLWNYSAQDMCGLSSLGNLEQLDIRTAALVRRASAPENYQTRSRNRSEAAGHLRDRASALDRGVGSGVVPRRPQPRAFDPTRAVAKALD